MRNGRFGNSSFPVRIAAKLFLPGCFQIYNPDGSAVAFKQLYLLLPGLVRQIGGVPDEGPLLPQQFPGLFEFTFLS